MKSNLKSSLVVFLVAMLVMQVVFNDGRQAGAAHSATGKISHVNTIRVVVEDGTGKLSPCYCIARTLYCQNNDVVTSDVMNIDAQKSFLLNSAFLYGYHVNVSDRSQITAEAVQNYNMTQDVIWLIMEGKFDGTTNTTQRNINYDQTIINKVVLLNTAPSYIDGKENVMKWNACTKKFELELTNTTKVGNESANANVQVDTTTLPKGVTATVNGDVIKLESTEEFTTTQSFNVYKRAPGKGKVVAWQNGGGSKQPQITLDYDEDPIAKVMEVKIKTEAKPVEQTPAPTVQPTVKPEEPTVQPTQKVEEPKEEVKAEEKVEVKQETLKEETPQDLDEVPKTADASNLGLVFQLLGASGITLVWFAVATLIKKRKEALAE